MKHFFPLSKHQIKINLLCCCIYAWLHMATWLRKNQMENKQEHKFFKCPQHKLCLPTKITWGTITLFKLCQKLFQLYFNIDAIISRPLSCLVLFCANSIIIKVLAILLPLLFFSSRLFICEYLEFFLKPFVDENVVYSNTAIWHFYSW